MKSKLSTAKKSQTAAFSRVFAQNNSTIFRGKSKLNFWTKNEDFEQCVIVAIFKSQPVISISLLGRLDILVNSAGILVNGSTETLSEEDFDKCMNINCKSAFVLTQACLPYLLETKGNIVHVSSVTGLRAFPNVVAYSMSKAAVDQLTRYLILIYRVSQQVSEEKF